MAHRAPLSGSMIIDDSAEDDGPNFYSPDLVQPPTAESLGVAEDLRGMVSSEAQTTTEDKNKMPIFSLSKIDYDSGGKAILFMEASSDRIVMGLDNGHIIRLDLKHPEELEDVDVVKKPEDQIQNVFLDHTGHHLLIAMSSAELLYFHSSHKKPKTVSKARGVHVAAAAWDRTNQDINSTGVVLLGTQNGLIIEAQFEKKEGESRWKEVFRFRDDPPINGLRLEQFPTPAHTPEGDVPRWFVMVTTSHPNRLWQFVGGPTMTELFSLYETSPGYHEVPGSIPGEKPLKPLQVYQATGANAIKALPTQWAWLTQHGVYTGSFLFGSQQPGGEVICDNYIIPYPSTPNKNISPFPLSITTTPHHMLLLLPDRVRALSRISDEVVWEETFPNRARIGRLRALCHDVTTGSIWLVAERCVWQVVLQDETRDLWQFFLNKHLYDTALFYCRTEKQKDKVWSQQAEELFERKAYDQAAVYFAKTRKPLEEVVSLLFDEKEALKTYLVHRLEHLHRRDATQRTILMAYLTEFYVMRLNQMNPKKDKATFDVLQQEFLKFLQDFKEELDRNTTYGIISAHGHSRLPELLFYANLIEDYERVIGHYINYGQYEKAVSVLSAHLTETLVLKFAPALMVFAPCSTIDAFIKAGKALNPRKLLPALMRYSPDMNEKETQQHQVIRYLEYIVAPGPQGLDSRDPAVHNLLLALYSKETDDTAFLRFLEREGEVFYDLKYALRLCVERDRKKATVLIYGKMALYEQAVDLALKLDVDLATQYADHPDVESDEVRKKLWLMIAKHVLEKDRDIRRAQEFMARCPLLKIEDLLPFFPTEVLINDFKEAICSSLEMYNHEIERLKVDMEESTKSASLVREDIQKLGNRIVVLQGNQKCDACHGAVITRIFYYFPCQHIFHLDCLVQELKPFLNRDQLESLQDMISKTDRESQNERPRGGPKGQQPDPTQGSARLDALKTRLDEIIGTDCVYCGDFMLRVINEPFETDQLSWLQVDRDTLTHM